MRDFFTGQVPIVSGELGEDFTYYFSTSEQDAFFSWCWGACESG